MVENVSNQRENAQTQKEKKPNTIRAVPVPKNKWGKFWYGLGNIFHKVEERMDYISRIKHPYFISFTSALILGLATYGACNLVSGGEKEVSDHGFYEKVESLRGLERRKFLNDLERFLNEQKNGLSTSSR